MTKGKASAYSQENHKQCLKNYRYVLLLPICCKILEHSIFNKMFLFLIICGLTLQSQARVKPGNSCVNQLLSITHLINKSFAHEFEAQITSLDISKAFDKV